MFLKGRIKGKSIKNHILGTSEYLKKIYLNVPINYGACIVNMIS
jgi:hypothetical protein